MLESKEKYWHLYLSVAMEIRIGSKKSETTKIRISINTNISVIRFYKYIININKISIDIFT